MQIKLGYNEIPRTMLRKQVCYKEITLNRKEGKGRNMVKVSEPGLHGSLECRIWTTEMWSPGGGVGEGRGGRHRKRWGSKNAVISARHLETGIIPNNHLVYGSATHVSESNRLLVTNASGCQVGLLNS